MKDKQKRQIRERFLSFVKVIMSTSLQMCSTESKPHGYWMRAKDRQRREEDALLFISLGIYFENSSFCRLHQKIALPKGGQLVL